MRLESAFDCAQPVRLPSNPEARLVQALVANLQTLVGLAQSATKKGEPEPVMCLGTNISAATN